MCEGTDTRIVELGSHGATIPSIVFLDDSGQMLVGDSAARRAVLEPARSAREFKRRFGDTTPIFVGGSPYSADALMAELLKSAMAQVVERQGGPPTSLAITHPANWGSYKLELLEQVVRRANVDSAVMLSEPEAAVLNYAQNERVPAGSVIAVFDLGGGTFDASVIRKTTDGVETLGEPEGLERLGGIDLDETVFNFVVQHLDGALDDIEMDSDVVLSALARLKADCVDAKVALSSDESASIPVMLPSVQTTVRITRGEFESLARPALASAIEALRRALSSAGVSADELTAVLLAGGSSRIPIVAEMVAAEVGRPVAVDAHPKHIVARGAALAAMNAAGGGAASAAPVTAAPAAPSVAPVAAAPVPPVAPVADPIVPATIPVVQAPMPSTPVAPAAAPAPIYQEPAPVPAAVYAAPPATGTSAQDAARSHYEDPPKSRKGLWIGLGVVVALLAGLGLASAFLPADETTASGSAATADANGATTVAGGTTASTAVGATATTTASGGATTAIASPTTATAPTTDAADFVPQFYGDDPMLDALYDSCDSGFLDECDELWVTSAVGSDYEFVGDSCGGHTFGAQGNCTNPGGLEYSGFVFGGSAEFFSFWAFAGEEIVVDTVAGDINIDILDEAGNPLASGMVSTFVQVSTDGYHEVVLYSRTGSDQDYNLFLAVD